ncbi:MAG: zinc-ribbon domain-containing protein [Methanobacteriota archaeon]
MPYRRPMLRFLYAGQVVYGVVAGGVAAALVLVYLDGALSPLSAVLGIAVLVAATVAFLIYLQNLYERAPAADYSEACPECGALVNKYSEFCEHCGADLVYEERVVRCPECSHEVYEGVRFCPECGAAIG